MTPTERQTDDALPLAASARAAAELAAAERAEPVPETLAAAVMRGVWADLRRPQLLPLPTGAGPAFVALRAATSALEQALDRLLDVQVHTCTLLPVTSADAGPAPAVPTMSVRLVTAAEYGVDLVGWTGRVRELVGRTVREQLGWSAGAVDIDLVDVYVPGTDA